jgi:CMP-N-acetylneuraminic acid synthetase
MVTAIIGIKEISQRVKNKNFKILGGKPLYSWILGTLQEIDEITEIILNIQGEGLFNLLNEKYSSNNNIKLLRRDKSLEGHETPMTEIISSSLNDAKNDTILNTHTTNPFLSKQSLSEALNKFNHKKQPLFSVNVFQSRFYDHNIEPINHDPKLLLQTQDLNKVYEENSCFYIFDKDTFLNEKTRIFSNSMIFPLNKIESIDIDTNDDWQLAEIVASRFK